MPTVAATIAEALKRLGVTQIWGVVGDALNPLTDAIHRTEGLEWIGVRHEEVGAFAASAQAQLTGTLGVCMGTVGPGSVHLLNGLYDAAKSHAPVLAICGQVPRAEMGGDFFQEVDNDLVFRDVATFRHTITAPEQMPRVLEQAVNAAYARPGVAVLTLPGDVGSLDLPKGTRPPRFVTRPVVAAPDPSAVDEAVRLIDGAKTVTMLVGIGAREARDDVLALADKLSAPMVLTLKAKEGLEAANRFQVGQSGLLGNPASKTAFDGGELLLMLGTDFPYPEWLPQDATVVQVDRDGAHIGRRAPADLGVVGDAGTVARALLQRVAAKTDTKHLDEAVKHYERWQSHQEPLTRLEKVGVVEKVRGVFDNPGHDIRPEAVAASIHRQAASDAIFTCDTGMSAVWMARFVELTGDRRLLGSFNLGSMANAMPQALGAAGLDRSRQVIAFCGDGGLTMLLGDLLTAVGYGLPVKLVVFDNSKLGMVKLEQEQVGLPEHGTSLTNPDLAAVARACGLHGIRVTEPADLDAGVAQMLAHDGPVLLDVVTNPDEVALPPDTTVGQAKGFAVAKGKEILSSH